MYTIKKVKGGHIVTFKTKEGDKDYFIRPDGTYTSIGAK
jgi:hypothetical protein